MPNQCTPRVIVAVEQCVVGFQMSWVTFLLNELLDDAINSQKKGKSLTYSWLLILISFVAWVEFPNYQVIDVNVLVPC